MEKRCNMPKRLAYTLRNRELVPLTMPQQGGMSPENEEPTMHVDLDLCNV